MNALSDSEKRLLFKGLRDAGCMGPWTDCPDYEILFADYVDTLPPKPDAATRINGFVAFAAAARYHAGGIFTNLIQKIIQSLIQQIKPTPTTRVIDWAKLFQQIVAILLDMLKPRRGETGLLDDVAPKPKPAPKPAPTPAPPAPGPVI
jgi:hypothetical protein